ncbi:acetate kinase [Acaricomes phytoseiuli]|uniref:acetate/propionate family kinase n=1 Tax=Acaricomes phytoseiuli TaxID=291968 RepID=UPI002223AFC9|nr:acetate kinase [Acaricomes phytoseiuli]MCW1249852.1 acetate kinase [Acaricomes phytoseiuli]
MKVLVINAGSSSLKYQLRDVTAGSALYEGVIEKIGQPGGEAADHTQALDLAARRLKAAVGSESEESEESAELPFEAVGHRVVHGGERFGEPVLIDEENLPAIEQLSPLAPLHNPANVLGIRAIAQRWPDLPQVAVFDTAFHRTLPEHAWRYPIPDELYQQHGIRRYGFHGTSHEYVSRRAAEFLDIPLDRFRGIIAHLGNGASVTAIRDGQSVDTSMGFTPLEGLVMGTRSGDVDPSILVFLGQQGYSAEEIDALLNRRSGLLALAGSNDMREVEAAAEAGDERAIAALTLSSYRLAKYIGAYHIAVGGAEALVFTAGVGENSPVYRKLVADRLQALGIRLDEQLNLERSKQPRVISTPDSSIPVLVIPTDEERAIAEATAGLIATS